MAFECVLNKLQSGTATNISLEYDVSTISGNSATIEVTLNQACSNDGQPIPQKNLTDATINLSYEYTILSLARNDHPEAISFEEGNPQQFYHEYVITNSGPSRPNQAETFYLYLPTPVFGNLKDMKSVRFEKITTDVNVTCEMEGESVEDNEECNPCTRYTCEISTSDTSPFLKDSTSIIAKIDFDFNATKQFLDELKPTGDTEEKTGSNLTQQFDLTTILRVGEEKSSITTTLNLRRTEVGLPQVILEWWPIIVGCLGGIILFATVMYVAYRYGFHNKMRFARAAAMKKDDTYEAL